MYDNTGLHWIFFVDKDNIVLHWFSFYMLSLLFATDSHFLFYLIIVVIYVYTENYSQIAREIRLRDIGGIIVVDFIDMLDDCK